MLSKHLSPQSIRLQIQVKNWQEAVQASGDLLVKTGKCKPHYVDAMIQAIKDLGPYIVIAPGIALAHARPKNNTLQVGMSIVSLSTPVNFGSEANDPVKLVIAFCGIDDHSHIKMLEQLAHFLMKEDNQNMLKCSHSAEMVLKAIQQSCQETIPCQH